MIRNFDDIHAIRKEIRRINRDLSNDATVFASVKRLLVNEKILAAVPKEETITVRHNFNTPQPKQAKESRVQYSAIEKLSNILDEREEKHQLALHIDHLLSNHFVNEDSVVLKKLTALSKQLVTDTKKLSENADEVLKTQGKALAPADFKQDVSSLQAELQGQFDPPNIDVKYYVGVDKVQLPDNSKPNHLYYMAYITIKNLKTNNAIRDLLIVMTRRDAPRGGSKNFVRTFTNFISPVALMKTNIGVEFDSPARAFQIVMTALKVDKLIDVIDPSQIPVKKTDLKITNENIINQRIDEKNGSVTLYLSPKIKDQAAAEKVLQDVFVEVKKIIKSIHPRNKNTVKATVPKIRKGTFKTKTGETVKRDQYYFRIQFAKPETGDAVELPRDKVAQFMKVMDISNPDAAKHFNLLLKKFVSA